jgi:MoaA/NifB/PqqE/SkfB family radical SAM enzyme
MFAPNTPEPLGKPPQSRLLRALNPMRVFDFLASRGEHMRLLIGGLRRRNGWFLENVTLRRFLNMSMTGMQYLLKSERMYTMPVAVKIDISPMCNLSCTVCVHADPDGDAGLEKQVFHPQHRMSVDQFRRIINEIRGHSSAVSLYYVGDPLVHPDLDEMSSIARDAKLNVHISTNFSFALTDARIRRMISSGLSHLTVCVDGLSQQKYEMTRVGGKIERVLNNLRRVCEFKKEMGLAYPKVEVQYIKFQHNLDELEAARKLLLEMGIDQFTDFWGDLGNYTDRDPGTFDVIGPRTNKRVPQCYWPHGSTVIKYNGDVIPCCSFRIGHQYTESEDPRVLGNVFTTSLREIWNNKKYRDARRMVNNPEVIRDEPELENHFCYGCGAIFETTDLGAMGMANVTKWEDRYRLDEHGRPVSLVPPSVRNAQTVSKLGLPSGDSIAV